MTKQPPYKSESSWQLSKLVLAHVVIMFLIGTLLLPTTSGVWKWIDVHAFSALQSMLKTSHPLRVFWALANHKWADWVEDGCFLFLYLLAIAKIPKGHRSYVVSSLCICVLVTAASIILFNRVLFRDCLHLKRASPTAVIDSAIILKEHISWLSIKTVSSKSFPGDHGTTALMLSLSYAYLIRGRLAIVALCYGVFLCLPRLVVGAHWASDIIVGSGSIVLFALSWTLFSPLTYRISYAVQHRWKKKIS